MRASRLVILATALLVLIFAIPADATCYSCRNYNCYMSEGSASWCRPVGSGGTGCFYGGICESPGGGLGCDGDGEPTCDNGFGFNAPLSRDYQLAYVKIEHHKAATKMAAVSHTAAQH